MKKKLSKEELIKQLVAERTPTQPMIPPKTMSTLFFLLIALMISTFLFLTSAVERSNWLTTLMSKPTLLLQIAVGIPITFFGIYAIFLDALPDLRRFHSKFWLISILLYLGFAGVVASEYIWPKLGKVSTYHRSTCIYEIIFYAILIGLSLHRVFKNRFLMNPEKSSGILGIASASVTAVLMQLACTYETTHALMFHVLPVLLIGLIFYVSSKVVLWFKRS